MRTGLANPSLNADFWPGDSLSSWTVDPEASFTAWLANQRVCGGRQLRQTSVATYRAMFAWWVSGLQGKNLTLLEATELEAAEQFSSAEFEPVSRRRYLQLLDRVYQHLVTLGWAGDSPVRRELRCERELMSLPPETLTPAQEAQLLSYLSEQPEWRGERDRGMAALLLGAGLRVNEAIALSLGAIPADFSVRVYPKGVHRAHTSLVLPAGPFREWWLNWRQVRRELQIPGEVACPAVLGGRAFSPSGLFVRVQAWLEPLGLGASTQGPSLLRNTFACSAMRTGRYSVETVQEFLGHESRRATERLLGGVS